MASYITIVQTLFNREAFSIDVGNSSTMFAMTEFSSSPENGKIHIFGVKVMNVSAPNTF